MVLGAVVVIVGGRGYERYDSIKAPKERFPKKSGP